MEKPSTPPIEFIDRVTLHRVGTEENTEEAGLWITSLPWPRATPQALSLGGNASTQFPLGAWPGEASPRRLLLYADAEGKAPATLPLVSSQRGSQGWGAEKPKASMELFARSSDENFIWERHFLRVQLGQKTVGIAMGLKKGDAVHWWEACSLVIQEETDECIVLEMGGAIPNELYPIEEGKAGYKNRFLHRHNWLNGHLSLRVFANGVCEVYAHHINSKFMDDGLALEGVVPVIGFRQEKVEAIDEVWDGTRTQLTHNEVSIDLSEVAPLATTTQPGHLFSADGFLVLQPYEGAELYGGICAEAMTGDPFIFRSTQKTFPRGMARTLRFSLSLSERSPRIARYLAPGWWYGLCEELLPEPLLPVTNEYEPTLHAAESYCLGTRVAAGFEEGSIPRNLFCSREKDGRINHEPGWEGEIAYAMFLQAWRTGNGALYEAALRSAYYFSDVCIDHAAKLVRMHGYGPHAFSLPMNRVQATFAAYLETGDTYLLDAAEAVTTNAHWQHKNSWPRLAVGRDACYIRSAVLLYRYTGNPFFQRIAREGALSVVHSQRPSGSFGDQGGGTGIHQWSAYITKPWMGLLAINGVIDYLELFPNEEALFQTALKFADWLMEERWEYEGGMIWSYQHDFDGRREYTGVDGKVTLFPTNKPWHHDSLARLMGYITVRTGDPRYLDAWAKSYSITPLDPIDHAASAALQFLPWLQAKLENARPFRHINGAIDVCASPVHFGPRTPARGRVQGP